MTRLLTAILLGLLALAGSTAPSAAAGGTVYVADGVTAVSYDDSLSGSNARDYLLPAHKGQKLEVMLSAKSSDVYFRVLSPGGEKSLYNSHKDGDHAGSLKIASNGRYTIRVQLKDVEAGHTRHYSLMMRLK